MYHCSTEKKGNNLEKKKYINQTNIVRYKEPEGKDNILIEIKYQREKKSRTIKK